MRRVVLLCVSLLLTLPVLAGIPGVDVAVQVSARGQAAPAAIILSWPLTPSAGMAYHAHTVYRKAAHDTTWGTPLATLAGTAAGFTDTHVTPGVGYEYQVIRDAEADGLTFHGYGYVYAGIGLAAVERRGTVLLLVDARQAAPLRAELAQLAQDLVGDGWQVRRHDIDPTLTDKQVKALIAADYHADPAHVTAVLLLGHVAVPYSGNIAPDGHPNHQGAWPADMYYADMTGTWTDITVDNTAIKLRTERNRNVPGDGKWDQDHLPVDGAAVLAVGRVDMHNLPTFAAVDPTLTETGLLRRYLDKDHRYRHGLAPFDTVRPRALLGANPGNRRADILAMGSGGDALFGPGATDTLKWTPAATADSYTWGFGYTVGDFTSLNGHYRHAHAGDGADARHLRHRDGLLQR